MTDQATPTDRESVEALALKLENDAEDQFYQPCEMTGLSPDDEHTIAHTLRALLSRAEKAEAERDEAREALRPFVVYVHDDLRKGDHRYKFVRTSDLGGGWIAAEDFRRARAALNNQEEGK